MSDLPRYIFLSDAILDREKITIVRFKETGSIMVHFDNGDSEEWDADNAREILEALKTPRDWKD